ncbi:MAG: hypothetical protein SPK49_02135, partial [Erysipelotrichaceae bacterium]|nr:hypothetical protein [Erysipelotrichaceae bacterium]
NIAMAKFLDYHGLSKLVEKIKNTYVNKNEQYEANLKWGGGNFADSFGPIDGAMIPELGANRFAFGYPNGITIEYSNDGGSTWHDYGASDEQKLRLTSTSTSFILGKSSSVPPSTLNKLRITFDTLRISEGGIGCYAELSKFYIKIGTKGMTNCYCTIQVAKNTENITYNEIATKVPIRGWTGDNIINVPKFRTAYTSNDSNYTRKIRFIFGADSIYSDKYSNMEINAIQAFGGTGWQCPSIMADTGRLYQYDNYQNATFPANVKATNFIGTLQGNANSASKLGTATVGGVTKPIYLNGGTPTACTHSIESDVPSNAKFTDTWRPLGNTADTACAGNDSRLSDSRRASDVYAWAKAVTKPSYSWGEITDKPSSFTPVSHNHDDRYYTETEMNSKLDKKVDNTVNGCNALLSKLNTLTGSPIDDEYFIRQDAAGSSTFGRVKFSTLWSYIKNKSDNIYQPTGSYAAASHTHTKNQITDFPSSLKNPTSLTIKGNGSPMAVYDGSEAKIVNITKSSIGLEHVDNTADIDKTVKSAASADKVNGHTVNKDVPSNAVFTDKNVYQVSDNSTTTVLPLLLSPLSEDTKADEVHQTTNAKYNFSIGAVPSEGKIKATIFDGTTFTGNAATATKASQDGDGNTISSTYLKLIGGTMSGTITTVKDSKPAIDFRGQHGSYGATLNYDTAGNEALAVNLQQATTSFMVNSGTNGKTWTSSGKYSTVTPTLQVKGKYVSINKFIPDNTTPTHTLEVNGSIKATSFDGTASRA